MGLSCAADGAQRDGNGWWCPLIATGDRHRCSVGKPPGEERILG